MINWDEWFYYDESSPTYLRWKVEVRSGRQYKFLRFSPGDIAGSYDTTNPAYNYARVKKFGKRWLVHRIIWEMFNGPIGEKDIDHLDGDTLNNKLENLSVKTRSGNCRNQKKRVTNTSGVTGLAWLTTDAGKYTYVSVSYAVDGKNKLKCFSVTKLGLLPAFAEAWKYRKSYENDPENGYTDRHGS